MSMIETLTEVTSYSFRLGLQIAVPVMTALLLSITILGLISRTLPQLNVLAVGFSVNSIVMLSALLLSLGILSRVFHEHGFVAIDLMRPVYDSRPP
jgi:flagellar biosynthetic protein FliR